MSDTVRAFIALPVPDPSREQLEGVQRTMRRLADRAGISPRWTKPEQLHVTLKFMGDLPSEKLSEVTEVMKWHAQKSLAIETHWTGVIAFGGPRRAGAIVAGVADDQGLLSELASRIEDDVIPLGVERERRAFRAHVTLVRVKARTNVAAMLDASLLEPKPVKFEELRLYESRLTRDGSVYSALAREPLAG